jgi:hypothetical protein
MGTIKETQSLPIEKLSRQISDAAPKTLRTQMANEARIAGTAQGPAVEAH